jgi:hypothetical protein
LALEVETVEVNKSRVRAVLRRGLALVLAIAALAVWVGGVRLLIGGSEWTGGLLILLGAVLVAVALGVFRSDPGQGAAGVVEALIEFIANK